MTVAPTLLYNLLDAAARTWPDRTAVSHRRASYTFAELAAMSRRAGARMSAAGVRHADRVVLVLPSDPEVAALAFGAGRLGAVFVLLHDQVRGRGLEHVLDDCEPTLVVTDDPSAAALARDRAITVRTAADLLGDPADAEAAGPTERPLAVDPVCLIYTSGTTAMPKAVVSTHQQVLFATAAIQSVLRYRPDDIVYCPLPLSFDYGLYQVFLGASSGAHVRLAPAAEAGPPMLRGLLDSRATVLAAVPSVAEALAWLVKRTSSPPVTLRLLTNTGAAVSGATLGALRAALPSLRVQVMYGLTECKRTAIMPPDGDLTRPGSCGLPLPGTAVSVVDDDGRPLPAGELGQFVVRGPHVMAGYWRRPELTAQRFARREGLFPELHTGDFGWLDEDGYLYFSGRRDDLYKERGFRVSATEVEAAAHRVPGVVSAAVLPPQDGSASILVVVGDVTADEVSAAMRELIEPFKVPRRCVVRPELPLSGNGKVDRQALRAALRVPSAVTVG
jgi:acyl-CoA synthetase (AMP-forming)/AMP-acid ligase II